MNWIKKTSMVAACICVALIVIGIVVHVVSRPDKSTAPSYETPASPSNVSNEQLTSPQARSYLREIRVAGLGKPGGLSKLGPDDKMLLAGLQACHSLDGKIDFVAAAESILPLVKSYGGTLGDTGPLVTVAVTNLCPEYLPDYRAAMRAAFPSYYKTH